MNALTITILSILWIATSLVSIFVFFKFKNSIVRLKKLCERQQYDLEDFQQSINLLSNHQERFLHAEKMASIKVLAEGLAHELNNPLSMISGSITPIRNDLMEIQEIAQGDNRIVQLIEEVNSCFNNIHYGTKRIALIIKGLLYGGQINSTSRQSLSFNVTQIIKSNIDYYTVYIGYRNIILDIPEETFMTGRESEINLFFSNVLRNAFEATKSEKDTISISYQHINDMQQFTISDTGCGINRKDLKRVFEPFFTTKAPNNNGLGLFIAHAILNKYVGQISIESQPGNGAQVDVFFPDRLKNKSTDEGEFINSDLKEK